jgi:hypothetical protein
MKNYKVIATRYFRDSSEIDKKTGLKVERKVNDEFYCTKERYEFLKANNAVKLVEVQSTIDDIITEEEVQAVASAIVEEAEEQNKTVEEVVNEIVEESKEEVFKTKPKKKKSSKK